MCQSKPTPSPFQYERRSPENSKLYKIIAEHWHSFLNERASEGRDIPPYIIQEFEAYLRCGILAYGFGRLHCETCNTDKFVPFSCKGRGFCPSCGARRMAEEAIYLKDQLIPLAPVRQFVVTFPPPLRLWLSRSSKLTAITCRKIVDAISKYLRKQTGVKNGLCGMVVFIQRFGSGANLHLHLHIIAIDGVYEIKEDNKLQFHQAQIPNESSTKLLVEDFSTRINNHLVKKGILKIEEGIPLMNNTDELFSSDDTLHLPAQAASVTNKIAFGVNSGKPLRRLKLQTRDWPSESNIIINSPSCVTLGGYSLHATTIIKAEERDKLEKLVCYMARPAISEERIFIEKDGTIKLRLKTPWKDGSEFLLFSPNEFIEKLIALIPLPGHHLTRYYGVFASRSPHRNKLPNMPPDKNENGSSINETVTIGVVTESTTKNFAKKRMDWAQLLKRTFAVDVKICSKCQGQMILLAVINDGPSIKEILERQGLSARAPPIAPARSEGLFSFD